MIKLTVPAPTENRIPRTKTGFKKKPNGKRADPVPAPAWLNSNQSLHYQKKADRVKLWRDRAAELAKDLPQHTQGYWFAIAEVHHWQDVTYDPQNFYPTAKAIIDGIVGDHGFLPDDSLNHLAGPLCVPGAKSAEKPGYMTLYLFDMNQVADREMLLWKIDHL